MFDDIGSYQVKFDIGYKVWIIFNSFDSCSGYEDDGEGRLGKDRLKNGRYADGEITTSSRRQERQKDDQ